MLWKTRAGAASSSLLPLETRSVENKKSCHLIRLSPSERALNYRRRNLHFKIRSRWSPLLLLIFGACIQNIHTFLDLPVAPTAQNSFYVHAFIRASFPDLLPATALASGSSVFTGNLCSAAVNNLVVLSVNFLSLPDEQRPPWHPLIWHPTLCPCQVCNEKQLRSW